MNWLEPVDLAYVVYHWSSAYVINMTNRTYEAARRDDSSTVLRADTAEDLLVKIRADHAAKPVPRG